MNTIRALFSIVCMLIGMVSLGYGQCEDKAHSPFANDGWVSCTTSVAPVTERGDVHWIQYDLGHVYNLDSIYIWNHNVWGQTGYGVKEVHIDYSIDGTSWQSAGVHTIDQAPGSWRYQGSQGPILDQVDARYLLFSVLSTWDPTAACAGISEIKINVDTPTNTYDVANTEWSISPNPTYDQLEINLDDVSGIQAVEILDAIGRRIQFVDHQASTSLSVADWQEGIYFVRVLTEERTYSKSFVKI